MKLLGSVTYCDTGNNVANYTEETYECEDCLGDGTLDGEECTRCSGLGTITVRR